MEQLNGFINFVEMNKEQLYQELSFKTSRSGGAGGQHVNKVSSKVELIFDVNKSLQLMRNKRVSSFLNWLIE